MNLRVFAIVGAALLSGIIGLAVSIRHDSAGFLPGTAAGRWLAEHVAAPPAPAGARAASEGEVIGPLALTGLDGKPHALPATNGQRMLVNVWASWCAPCREEMPLLVAFARQQGAGGVVVLGIAQDDALAVRSYLRRTPVDYPILLDDTQGRAGVRLGNRLGALPYSALIDSNGRLVRRKYGPFTSVQALAAWVSAP